MLAREQYQIRWNTVKLDGRILILNGRYEQPWWQWENGNEITAERWKVLTSNIPQNEIKECKKGQVDYVQKLLCSYSYKCNRDMDYDKKSGAESKQNRWGF